MNKDRICEALNHALAFEYQAIIQYVSHSVRLNGPDGLANADGFMDIAKAEMEHAESLLERIDFLGGVPVVYPAQVMLGGSDVLELAGVDTGAEATAQSAYQNLILVADEENDITTKELGKRLLAEEEAHAYYFQTLVSTSDGPIAAPAGLADL